MGTERHKSTGGPGKQAGLTYLPPREPAILGDVWGKIIQR